MDMLVIWAKHLRSRLQALAINKYNLHKDQFILVFDCFSPSTYVTKEWDPKHKPLLTGTEGSG